MSGITVEIPAALRRFTGNAREIEVKSAGTVQDALREVVTQHPPLEKRLLASDGRLYSFVGVFVNGRDVRQLQSLTTPLHAGDVVSLVPAVAGG